MRKNRPGTRCLRWLWLVLLAGGFLWCRGLLCSPAPAAAPIAEAVLRKVLKLLMFIVSILFRTAEVQRCFTAFLAAEIQLLLCVPLWMLAASAFLWGPAGS